MSKENLRTNLTPKEARDFGKKGGIESGKVRRKKRALKEILQAMLTLKPPKDTLNKLCKIYPDLSNEDLHLEDVIALAQIQRAAKGSERAFELIRDTIGEKPKDELKLEVEKFNSEVSDKIKNIIEKCKR
jgi:hypothetical protein